MKFYAFYDRDLELYNPPFSAADDNAAVKLTRNMLINASDSVLNKVLSITDLECIGSFDEKTGVFENDKHFVCALDSIPLPNYSLEEVK